MGDDSVEIGRPQSEPNGSADERTDAEWSSILKPPPRRYSFSLRTMFFIVTCVAVFFAGVRVSGPHGAYFAFGGLILSSFLAIWSFAKGSFPIRPGVFVLLAIFFAMASLPTAVMWAKAHTREIVCKNNLFQIGLALKSYHQRYGCFPPTYTADAAGRPLCSWRALVFSPQMQSGWIPKPTASEPWNGPTNSALASSGTPVFHCPDDDQPYQMTSYLAIVGPHTAWPAPGSRKLSEIKNPAKTILVIEMEGSGINWLEPRDLFAGQLKDGFAALAGSRGAAPHPDGFNVLFADGHVETLPANIDPAELAKMIEVDQGDAGREDPNSTIR
jgi:prepilin-type processing-associated H-X9-DG protein